MQKQLCQTFGKNFPFTAAAMCVGNVAYSDFDDAPLRQAMDHQTVSVIFSRQVLDSSGYDQVSRKRGNKITLEDECKWEAQTVAGETDLDLEEWILSTKNDGGQVVSALPSTSS